MRRTLSSLIRKRITESIQRNKNNKLRAEISGIVTKNKETGIFLKFSNSTLKHISVCRELKILCIAGGIISGTF